MITFYIGSAYSPKEVAAPEDSTVKEVYSNNNISITNETILTLNSRRLGDAELDKTLEELGVSEGDQLTITEKYRSAI